MEYRGDKNILKNKKTAFLCSQKCPTDEVQKIYDWAKKQRMENNVRKHSNMYSGKHPTGYYDTMH